MTDYRHPASGGGYGSPPPLPTPGGPRPRPGSGGTPWWRLWWVVGIGALILGVIIGAASAGSSKKTEAAASTTTETATATVHSTVTATPGVTVTATPTINRIVATRTRTQTEIYTPPPLPTFSDGTYEAGTDIKPGRYHTDGGDDCYYEVDRSLDGGIDDIVSNDNISGTAYASVKRGQYLKVSGGCDWSEA